MYRRNLLTSIAVSALCVATFSAETAIGQERQNYNIPSQDLGTALRKFAKNSKLQVIFDGETARGKRSGAITNQNNPDAALRELLQGTGLTYQRNGKIYIISPAQTSSLTSPYLPSALASAAAVQAAVTAPAPAPQYDEIIVTAQKKEERITDVPIAMSAFSADKLDDYKIEGGSELLRAVPNMNFSKGNFSTYNISIRGIGTKAVSASTDPAVAVSFNNAPLIRNRLFEAEFFDLQRIEVLRGPQGTLYGRNATGGVVNILPSRPIDEFEGNIRLEAGNYKTRRLAGMLNIPLSDTLAIRGSGALTKRDGFDFNTHTQKSVNGRDLWSTRLIAEWAPNSTFNVNFIWQRFQENDDRSRTGKQLCARDPGPETINGFRVPDGTLMENATRQEINLRGRLSQGCLPVSLYDERSYGAPNASGHAAYVAGSQGYVKVGILPGQTLGVDALIQVDPYAGVEQSRNLRQISTSIDPKFLAKNDIYQINFEKNIHDEIKFFSQTTYARDYYYSTQDYNRYVSNPIFRDTSTLVDGPPGRPEQIVPLPPPLTPIIIPAVPDPNPVDQSTRAPNGIFCDYQLGCSSGMLSMDLSRSRNKQWSQEFRLQSDFDSNVNFGIGVNYLNFQSQDDYFVFNNLFNYISIHRYNSNTQYVITDCSVNETGRDCVYIDENPIGKLDENGHNYFRTRNNVKTESYSLFGEFYLKASSNLNVTIGARVTRDDKTAILYPSQLLLGGGVGGTSGGRVAGGYPPNPPLKQRWTKPTGRFVVDWKPDTSFSDDTTIYLSASRGYKGGGANPARPDINAANVNFGSQRAIFDAEYVNAFELGAKNSFGNGRLNFNLTGFFYDYKGYQISKIIDRIAQNENFDAVSYGLELEAVFRPTRNFQLDANLGILKTRLKDGSKSVDVMNRTQGDPDWVIIRPFLQAPSNCIAPKAYVDKILRQNANFALNASTGIFALCGQSPGFGNFIPAPMGTVSLSATYGISYDPFLPYDPSKVGVFVPYNAADLFSWKALVSGAPNGGAGFDADLSGNELPNSPRVTFNLGVQQSIPVGEWSITARGDFYIQSKSYARVYNTNYDRLKSWNNINASLSISNKNDDVSFEVFVKNVLNKSPITDTFTNSDDSLLTTNIFVLEPRLVAFRVLKSF